MRFALPCLSQGARARRASIVPGPPRTQHFIIEFDDGRALLTHLRMRQVSVRRRPTLSAQRLGPGGTGPRWTTKTPPDLSKPIRRFALPSARQSPSLARSRHRTETQHLARTPGRGLRRRRSSPSLRALGLLDHRLRPFWFSRSSRASQTCTVGLLFIEKCRLSFASPTSRLPPRQAVRRARELMRRNRGGPPDHVRHVCGTPYYVYERSGNPA